MTCIIRFPQHQLSQDVSIHFRCVFVSGVSGQWVTCVLYSTQVCHFHLKMWAEFSETPSQWVFLWLSSPEASPTCQIILSFERYFLWPSIHCRSGNCYLGETEMWEDLSDSRWGWRCRHTNPSLSASPWATSMSHSQPRFSCVNTGFSVCRWDLTCGKWHEVLLWAPWSMPSKGIHFVDEW